jgi:hypothetical protein
MLKSGEVLAGKKLYLCMKNVENDKACWITPGDGNIGERNRARVKSSGNNVTLIFHALQGSHGERKATHKCEG